MQMLILMMLGFSLMIETTTSIFYPPFCVACAKMAFPVTHSNVNGPSKIDWLGYWLTPCGLKPLNKKFDAILHLDHSCNATELHMFI
jgi:hypothetical protein